MTRLLENIRHGWWAWRVHLSHGQADPVTDRPTLVHVVCPLCDADLCHGPAYRA